MDKTEPKEPSGETPKRDAKSSMLEKLKNKVNDFYTFLCNVTFWIRGVSIVLTATCIASYCVHLEILRNVPLRTVLSLRLWTVLSGSLVPSSALNLLSCLFFWVSDATALEKSLGTVRYAIMFLINAVILQALYALVCLALVFPNAWPSNGLICLVTSESTLLCLANPEAEISLFFCMIKAKFYPYLLVGLFMVVHLGTAVDVPLGFLYAYLYYYFLRDRLLVSYAICCKIDNWVSVLRRVEGFVPMSDCTGDRAVRSLDNSVNFPDRDTRNIVSVSADKSDRIEVEGIGGDSDSQEKKKQDYVSLGDVA